MPKIGIVALAILLALTGIGIAQAGETHTIGEFMEWQTVDQGNSSSQYAENRPVLTFEDEVQLRNPIETGNLPAESNADSSLVEIEGVSYYRIGGILYGP